MGVVVARGTDAQGVAMGARVLPLGSAGGWARHKTVPADWCVPVPDGIGDEVAALADINPLTARLIVQALAGRPGDMVGVNAAASAAGRNLLRLLAAAGARPVANVRSARAAAALAGEPLADVVNEGGRLPVLDAGLDAVGGAAGAGLAAAVRSGGRVLHYGLLSSQPLTGELLRDVRAPVRPFWLRDRVHRVPRAELRAEMAAVFADLSAGRAAATVAGTCPLSDLRAALDHDADPDRRDKVVLTP